MALNCHYASIPGRISVVMPCYNAESFVLEAVDSVFGQSYPDVELVVVDDGSTDGTKALLDGYGARVRVLRQDQAGPAAARNAGIESSSGEFIAFLDADDFWDPDCLAKLHTGIEDGGAAISYCGWANVGERARNSQPFVPPDYENGQKLERLLKNAALWPIHGALTRRSALVEIGGFDARLRECEDYDLWLRLAATRPLKLVPEVLAYYRHHKDFGPTDKRGRDARAMWEIKRRFIAENPLLVTHLGAPVIRDCVEGGLKRRGFECYWNNELRSARLVFRLLLKTGHFAPADLKHLLPALLPERMFLALLGRRRALRS